MGSTGSEGTRVLKVKSVILEVTAFQVQGEILVPQGHQASHILGRKE